jgi:renalase
MAHILIVGAGLAGVLAAHELLGAGHEVTVVDKGHAPGGRLATRTVGDATFDHGAQFFTVRSDRFAGHVAAWSEAGVARRWFHGSPDRDTPEDPDGHPRYRGTPTMRSIAEHLASQLPVRLSTLVRRVEATGSGWRLAVAHRDAPTVTTDLVSGDGLLLTPPVPQSLALLRAGDVPLTPEHDRRLGSMVYDPCLSVLAVPDDPPTLPARGAMRIPDGDVTFLTDNLVTGASPSPAVTIHAGAAFSRRYLDASDDEIAQRLLALASPILGTTSRPVHVHRWRYSAPHDDGGAPCVLDRSTGAPLAFAGDAFAGGRVEGAATSGLVAADELMQV